MAELAKTIFMPVVGDCGWSKDARAIDLVLPDDDVGPTDSSRPDGFVDLKEGVDCVVTHAVLDFFPVSGGFIGDRCLAGVVISVGLLARGLVRVAVRCLSTTALLMLSWLSPLPGAGVLVLFEPFRR